MSATSDPFHPAAAAPLHVFRSCRSAPRRLEKSLNLTEMCCGSFFRNLMFPKSQDTPTVFTQCSRNFSVSCLVALDLRAPVCAPRSGHSAVLRTSMPEASVNEDGQVRGLEDKIRLAGQRKSTPPPSHTVLPQKSKHGEFCCPVALGPDLRHYAGSDSGRDVIHDILHQNEGPRTFAQQFRFQDFLRGYARSLE